MKRAITIEVEDKEYIVKMDFPRAVSIPRRRRLAGTGRFYFETMDKKEVIERALEFLTNEAGIQEHDLLVLRASEYRKEQERHQAELDRKDKKIAQLEKQFENRPHITDFLPWNH